MPPTKTWPQPRPEMPLRSASSLRRASCARPRLQAREQLKSWSASFVGNGEGEKQSSFGSGGSTNVAHCPSGSGQTAPSATSIGRPTTLSGGVSARIKAGRSGTLSVKPRASRRRVRTKRRCLARSKPSSSRRRPRRECASRSWTGRPRGCRICATARWKVGQGYLPRRRANILRVVPRDASRERLLRQERGTVPLRPLQNELTMRRTVALAPGRLLHQKMPFLLLSSRLRGPWASPFLTVAPVSGVYQFLRTGGTLRTGPPPFSG
mmetsp:Transcript_17686/g.51707  ORF Transcript_17686/g.51707 Transcript_17686/m.51707 type:complete len:266 (+) Transcript_17686:329-1126(+)